MGAAPTQSLLPRCRLSQPRTTRSPITLTDGVVMDFEGPCERANAGQLLGRFELSRGDQIDDLFRQLLMEGDVAVLCKSYSHPVRDQSNRTTGTQSIINTKSRSTSRHSM